MREILVAEPTLVRHCPYCGAEIIGDRMCLVHLIVDDEWAAGNRAMCAFLHRRREE